MIIDRRAADAFYRVSFGAFAYAAYPELNPNAPLVPNWHIDLFCHHLRELGRSLDKDGVADVEWQSISNRLVINLPPRSLKSFLVTVAWVAWCLGRNPSLQIICASYAEDLANKFSRDCRALIDSQFYKRIFPERALIPKNRPRPNSKPPDAAPELRRR